MQANTLKNTNKFLQDSHRYLNGNDTDESGLEIRLAQSQHEIIEAQKLRYRVFTSEFGAHIFSDEQRDLDEFDPFCKHLIALVGDRVVGTYRILFPEGAQQAGRMYTETEFDLATFGAFRLSTIELGRSCVDPEFRNGQVLRQLWSGLAKLLATRTESHLMGCVSVPMHDGGYFASSLYKLLQKEQLAFKGAKVFPFDPLPSEVECASCDVVIPPLMHSYIKLGAKLLGEPHWDLSFNVADFPMVVPIAQIEKRFKLSEQSEPKSLPFLHPQKLTKLHRRVFSIGQPQALAHLGA